MKLKDKLLHPVTLLIFFSFVLTIWWFRRGQMIAVGEEALPFYNPLLSLRLFASPWYETGTGVLDPLLLPRISLIILGSIFSFLNPTYSWVFEWFEMFILVSGGLIGMYLLVNKLLEVQMKKMTSIVITLFYLLNLYSLSQIFGRFLFTNIALWAFLPIFAYTFLRWIQLKERLSLVLMLIFSFIFSSAYGLPSNILVLWFPIFVFILLKTIKILTHKNEIWFFISRVFIFVLVWIIGNIWWLYSYISLGGNAFHTIEKTNSNFASLVGVSQYFSTFQIIQLRQSYLFSNTYLGWYNISFLILCSIVLFIVMLYGVWVYKLRGNWELLLILLIVGWFISKGTNHPLGYSFYKMLFTYIPISQLLRNSYEKFGIIFLVPYSCFFGIGFVHLINKFNVRFRMLSVFAFVLILLLLQWPFFTGDVFGGDIYNTAVTVPLYYQQANKLLDKNTSPTRILSLPMISGDGVKYHWSFPYIGAEPSEFLFNKPIISKILRSQNSDMSYWLLYKAVIDRNLTKQLLQHYNIQYIVVRNDLDTEKLGASYSADLKYLLDANQDLFLIKKVGLLDIYEVKGAEDLLFNDNLDNSLKYRKLSPIHYKIYINDIVGKENIIFSESYNPLWIAKIDGKNLLPHTRSQYYTNEWQVNRKGRYTIDVHLKIWPWE